MIEDEPKFTPGPWAIHDTRIGPYRFMSVVAEDYPFCIAELVDSSTARTLKAVKKDMRWDVFEANAVLMSYAPKMYAEFEEVACLLRAAAMFIENHYGDCPIVARMQHEIDNIDGLLAKARGKER